MSNLAEWVRQYAQMSAAAASLGPPPSSQQAQMDMAKLAAMQKILMAQSPFGTAKAPTPRFETLVVSQILKWLDGAVGHHAMPYVQVVIFSQRVRNRLVAENFSGMSYGQLAVSNDEDCVVLMQKPEGSPAAGAVLSLKIPQAIIEQIVGDEVRERMSG